MISKLGLYLSTVMYMKPVQMVNMVLRPIRLKRHYIISQKTAKRIEENNRKDVDFYISELDEDETYLSRFSYEGIESNVFTFLHEEHKIDLNEWKCDASPLWIFNLHYFEYAYLFANLWKKRNDDKYYTKFKELVGTWISKNKNTDISWHPYPTSLRIVNWLAAMSLLRNRLQRDEPFLREMTRSLYEQYRTLILRKEKWLLGNHYFENLFAIVLASFFFGEDRICQKYCKLLKREVKEQVLEDGMHFELSPMYHKIILADLLRLKQLTTSRDFPKCIWLDNAIEKMVSALDFLEIDHTPLFNDAGDNVAKDKKCLIATINKFGIKVVRAGGLEKAGYYRLNNGRVNILIDAGAIGPKYNPGHGHCDCLSFELAIDGETVFANLGTYKYQGSKRAYYRATSAHNTIIMDGQEQSQCWGEHRVGKRIRNIQGKIDEKGSFVGEYTNYLGQVHRRKIILKDDLITVIDSTRKAQKINSYLHIVDGYTIDDNYIISNADGQAVARVRPKGEGIEVRRNEEVTAYAPEFGVVRKGSCIEFVWDEKREIEKGYEIQLF